MKLETLIKYKKDEEILIDESVYKKAYELIAEAKKFQNYDLEKLHEKMSAKMPQLSAGESQINKILVDRNGEDKYGPDHPWIKRDFGKEVFGKPNAKELMSLVGDFKTYLKELKRIKQEYKNNLETWNKLYDSVKKESYTVRDDDKEGKGQALKKKYLEGYKKYVETIKSLDKQVQHYIPLFNKSLSKMSQYEVQLASLRSKEEIDNNIARSKEASKERFNNKVNNWKDKVKSLASLKKRES